MSTIRTKLSGDELAHALKRICEKNSRVSPLTKSLLKTIVIDTKKKEQQLCQK